MNRTGTRIGPRASPATVQTGQGAAGNLVSPKPTIAAVRGACLAGACELALACDLTIASPDAFFGEPELKFGAGIVVMILPWIVGPKIAKEIILTGEDRISAERAREIGMINRIVPSEALDEV